MMVMMFLKHTSVVLLYRYFDCKPMHGLFTPVHKLSSPESFVASDTRPSMPSPRFTVDYRQQDNPVRTVTVTFNSMSCQTS